MPEFQWELNHDIVYLLLRLSLSDPKEWNVVTAILIVVFSTSEIYMFIKPHNPTLKDIELGLCI